MSEELSRTELILGKEGMDKLAAARIAVFGIGGVGGYAAEALARCGVGALDLIDNDRISPSNLNRQIIALHSTIGQLKTDAAEERIKSIAPECRVTKHTVFYTPETAELIDFAGFDYIIDAVDTVTAKLEIIVNAKKSGVPVISSMGTGNKLDPSRLKAADIYKTSVCPLARVMRRELRKRGIASLKVVYSEEEPVKTSISENGRNIPGSAVFVPAAAGLLLASEAVRDIILRQSIKIPSQANG